MVLELPELLARLPVEPVHLAVRGPEEHRAALSVHKTVRVADRFEYLGLSVTIRTNVVESDCFSFNLL